MIRTLAVSDYRSLRNLVVPLGKLTVITGANGTGKSSLYRSLRLLAQTAQGRLVASLANEGGMNSVMWAGPETISRSMRAGEHAIVGTLRKKRVALRLGFAGDDFGYAVDLGLPSGGSAVVSLFALDPEIKRECIWGGPVFREGALLVDRRGPLIRARSGRNWIDVPLHLLTFESMLASFADPGTAPEIIALRERIRDWRFYDQWRTDAESPARKPRIGTYTPILADDGSDLPAALATIRGIGDGERLEQAIDDAFPGSRLEISVNDGWFELALRQAGLLRPLKVTELSDGTLRYLLLIAALLTPRPPELLVLNEPETSLHPDLIKPLAKMIGETARDTQVIVVTHQRPLADLLRQNSHAVFWELQKNLGETTLTGDAEIAVAAHWEWPARR